MLPPADFGKTQPFVYAIQITLDPSQSGQDQLTLASDSSFEFHYWMASSTLSDDADTEPNTFEVLVKVEDMDLSNGFIPQRVLCGPANWTVPQMMPIIFAPKTQFVFQFNNLVAGEVDNVVDFAMVGYKLII